MELIDFFCIFQNLHKPITSRVTKCSLPIKIPFILMNLYLIQGTFSKTSMFVEIVGNYCKKKKNY